MLSKKELRNAHISLAVGTVVLFVGGFLVRDEGEGAMQLVGVAMLIATFGTLIFLVDREDRQRKRTKGRSQ